MMYIILTSVETAIVSGPTTKGSALDPIQIGDNEYVLPTEVLSDNAHQVLHDYLASLPTRYISADEWSVLQGSD